MCRFYNVMLWIYIYIHSIQALYIIYNIINIIVNSFWLHWCNGIYRGSAASSLIIIQSRFLVWQSVGSATMNQLYHPQNTGTLFKLLAEYPSIPVFTITNNVIDDLTTFLPPSPSGIKKKTMEGIDQFMTPNRCYLQFIVFCLFLWYKTFFW